MATGLSSVIELLHTLLGERCEAAGCRCPFEDTGDWTCEHSVTLWRSVQDGVSPTVMFFRGEGEAVREFTYRAVVSMEPVLAWADEVHEYESARGSRRGSLRRGGGDVWCVLRAESRLQ